LDENGNNVNLNRPNSRYRQETVSTGEMGESIEELKKKFFTKALKGWQRTANKVSFKNNNSIYNMPTILEMDN
jgi:hypothetical protein